MLDLIAKKLFQCHSKKNIFLKKNVSRTLFECLVSGCFFFSKNLCFKKIEVFVYFEFLSGILRNVFIIIEILLVEFSEMFITLSFVICIKALKPIYSKRF